MSATIVIRHSLRCWAIGAWANIGIYNKTFTLQVQDDPNYPPVNPPQTNHEGDVSISGNAKVGETLTAEVHDADNFDESKVTKWVLTYDNVPQVAQLYSDLRRRLFALNYSAHRVMEASEIMVFSPELSIPEEIESAHADLVQVADNATERGC